MKYLFSLALGLFIISMFAQQKFTICTDYPLKSSCQSIARKSKDNIKHQTAWMTGLEQHGKIAGGYRFHTDGTMLTSAAQSAKSIAYIVNGDVVSSFLIINVTD